MGPRLLVEVKEIDDVNYVKLSGVVDEDNDLTEITNQVMKPAVLIDSGDVDRINSCGVRDWVTWLGELNKKGSKIFLLECSPAIMTQVNLVNNFVGPGSIVNFYAPYFCASCESDKMLLIDVADAKKSLPFKAPACRCNECDHTMEFDDIESSYFGFLNTVQSPNLPPNVGKAVKQAASKSEGSLKTRRTVVPPTSSSRGGDGSHVSTPTAPSTKDLKGLLTPVPEIDRRTSTQSMPMQAAAAPANVGKILYLVAGLLLVSIGLLAYVVLR